MSELLLWGILTLHLVGITAALCVLDQIGVGYTIPEKSVIAILWPLSVLVLLMVGTKRLCSRMRGMWDE